VTCNTCSGHRQTNYLRVLGQSQQLLPLLTLQVVTLAEAHVVYDGLGFRVQLQQLLDFFDVQQQALERHVTHWEAQLACLLVHSLAHLQGCNMLMTCNM
jgi:hypothetical protein